MKLAMNIIRREVGNCQRPSRACIVLGDSKYRFTSCVGTRGFTGDHDLSKRPDRGAKEGIPFRNKYGQQADTGISICNQPGDSGVPAVGTYSL